MGDQERAPVNANGEFQNAYQVYHKEGLLSHQSSVVPNAPLLYENQVMTKLRQGSSSGVNDKLMKLEQRLGTTPQASRSGESTASQSKNALNDDAHPATPTNSQEDKNDDSQGEVCCCSILATCAHSTI